MPSARTFGAAILLGVMPLIQDLAAFPVGNLGESSHALGPPSAHHQMSRPQRVKRSDLIRPRSGQAEPTSKHGDQVLGVSSSPSATVPLPLDPYWEPAQEPDPSPIAASGPKNAPPPPAEHKPQEHPTPNADPSKGTPPKPIDNPAAPEGKPRPDGHPQPDGKPHPDGHPDTAAGPPGPAPREGGPAEHPPPPAADPHGPADHPEGHPPSPPHAGDHPPPGPHGPEKPKTEVTEIAVVAAQPAHDEPKSHPIEKDHAPPPPPPAGEAHAHEGPKDHPPPPGDDNAHEGPKDHPPAPDAEHGPDGPKGPVPEKEHSEPKPIHLPGGIVIIDDSDKGGKPVEAGPQVIRITSDKIKIEISL
ncbi:hypothetical protein H4Q26_003900 [Puccinia striiformis f. sp. tritici PST-130]|nr:hypothetical protein H4Q26_003900 [Puccinia striiformis f. sp. tritici PST-130]